MTDQEAINLFAMWYTVVGIGIGVILGLTIGHVTAWRSYRRWRIRHG